MSKKLKLPLLVGVMMLGFTLSGYAQTPPSNAEHMEKLSGLIGTWKAEVKAREEIPGLAKKGDKLEITITFAWRLNKNAMSIEYSLATANGVRFFEFNGMCGWDASRDRRSRGRAV